jgi:hypothetical protein
MNQLSVRMMTGCRGDNGSGDVQGKEEEKRTIE